MNFTKQQSGHLLIAQSYYQKINSGDFNSDSYYNLFTEDVEVFYPKFGFAKGKEGVQQLGNQIRNLINSLHFEMDKFNYIVTDKYVVVEGIERGANHNGAEFPNNIGAYGKFCSVFEFEGNRIKRMHCYVDPDHAADDVEKAKMLKNKKSNDGL